MSHRNSRRLDEAEALAREGRVREALDCYDRALRESPDNDHLLASRATALITLGRYEDAIATCRHASSINPDSAATWTSLGIALEKVDRLPEAAEALERATRINPYDCYARALLGIVYQKLNLEDRAEAQNRILRDLVFPNEYAGFFFGTASFLLGMLLGGIRGVEGRPIEITIPSQVLILCFFIIICIVYWRSLLRFNLVNRSVILVPSPTLGQGICSSRGMYLVLLLMIVVFVIGAVLGSDVWNWMR
jgi:tetratricopeptide (TPR) repeat protein